MQLFRNFRPALIAAASTLMLAGLPASAEAVKVTQGRVELPTSGLVVDLPAVAGRSYSVSSSWSLSAETGTFDTRDVIDEFDASGTLIIGTWVQSGFFNAGSCADVLAETNLDASWTTKTNLWGEGWYVKGGIYTFTGDLGRRPAAQLCRDGKDGTSLLLHHYLVDRPDTTGQAETMQAVAASGVMAAASRSYSDYRVADVKPTLRPEVRKRGGDAARTVKLATNQMLADLPEDGYVWLTFEGDGVDFLERTMPSLPPVTVEVMALEGYSCAEVLGSFTENLLPDHKPANLPAGWSAGNGLNVDGDPEMIMCHGRADGAMMVGVFQGQNRDVTYLHPLLGALLNARRAN
ncbi:MAG: hypothetical protein ACK4HR_05530 [Hyphomonas sp.]|jgi:hypothetical protein